MSDDGPARGESGSIPDTGIDKRIVMTVPAEPAVLRGVPRRLESRPVVGPGRLKRDGQMLVHRTLDGEWAGASGCESRHRQPAWVVEQERRRSPGHKLGNESGGSNPPPGIEGMVDVMLLRLRNTFKNYFPPNPEGASVRIASETRRIPKGKQMLCVYLGMEDIKGPRMSEDQMIEAMRSMGWVRQEEATQRTAVKP